ncbi:prenyltransferase [Natranaerobius trueperi]|uniref:1,4-dihydroxy-2-naphthoate octaprenyltransferase n=1 Tax=Natranaerobius trueperi TaxID=759412 RepID=A0A226BWI3_9FIRM|nr:prenyltransferase [Natranaerobius trueperi]OWZ83142.1 hypothetical protein CDO51_10255 [Natranaerobius trueperi]
MDFKTYLKAVRPFSFPASIVPITIGSIWFFSNTGEFNLFIFLLVLLGGVCAHSGTNLTNDYYDYMNGIDTLESFGSSKILPLNILTPQKIFNLAIFMFTISFMIAILLGVLIDISLTIIKITGIVGGFFYTGPPLCLKSRALGIPLVFVMMGPLMTIGAGMAQDPNFSLELLLISIPIGCFVALILQANDLRDIKWDKRSGIKTLPILLGYNCGRLIFYLLGVCAFLIVPILVYFNIVSPISLLVLLLLPMFLKLCYKVDSKIDEQLLDIDVQTAKLHAYFGCILMISLLLK